MALNYEVVKHWPIPAGRQRYSRNDTILYALGVGANVIDDASEAELDFVWERRLKALPTMAAVLAIEPFWLSDPRTGVDWSQMLHGEQSIVWHAPLPAEGEVSGEPVVEEIYDKGENRGALLVLKRELRDAVNGTLLATVRSTVFLRADGGFGGPSDAPKPHTLPTRAADLRIDLATRPEQALIYRLSGDWIPLHVDPEFARAAGFPKPILHGLATYGLAGRAILKLLCGNDPARLKRLDARFSAPVFPGDLIRTEVWREGAGTASYRCLVGGKVVLNNGYVVYATA